MKTTNEMAKVLSHHTDSKSKCEYRYISTMITNKYKKLINGKVYKKSFLAETCHLTQAVREDVFKWMTLANQKIRMIDL